MKEKVKDSERNLTIKQRKWLKAYIECNNATEAAMKVYNCKDKASAGQIGYENLKKLDFSELMEEMGITDAFLSSQIAEGMTNPVKADITGAIHPDYSTRHKYLETALKTKKKGIDETTKLNPNIVITFTRGEDNGS